MFCSRCGKEASEESKYCSACGFSLQQSSVAGPSGIGSEATQPAKPSPINFQEFLKRKAESRKEHFKFKPKSAKKVEKDVSINIGIMRYVNGTLKFCRGRNLPVAVPSSASRDDILTKAVTKHANHDKNLIRGDLRYTLLYPDGTEVKTLPGSSDCFILHKYKDEIGKSYSRVTLYIATKSDVSDALFTELEEKCIANELSSDDESSTSVKELLVPTFLPKLQTSEPGVKEVDSKKEESFVRKEDKSVASPAENTHQREVECPTCSRLFPLNEIADHADLCADVWIGTVEDEAVLIAAEGSENPPFTADDTTDPTSVETGSIVSPEDLTAILETLQQQYVSEKEVRVNIRRKHIWSDFKQARKKFNLVPSNKIKVVFLGEPAVDDGGPRREFLSEMLEHVERKLFDKSGRPVASTVTLLEGDFSMAGELMVMSILQGGPAPNFLDSSVFQYLVKQPLCPMQLPTRYKEFALKVQEACNDDQLREVLMTNEGLDILEEIGYTGVPQREKTTSSNSLVQPICIKYLLQGSMPQIMQLQKGLSACNVLSSARENPALWKTIFVPGFARSISPEKFLDTLVVQFSLAQRHKEAEIDVYKHFCDFILGSQYHSSGETGFSMPSFLKWLTGCSGIPPLGFPKKFSLGFIHGCQPECKCRPTVSTCELLLKLPVHIRSEEEMEAMMLSALGDSYGFGMI